MLFILCNRPRVVWRAYMGKTFPAFPDWGRKHCFQLETFVNLDWETLGNIGKHFPIGNIQVQHLGRPLDDPRRPRPDDLGRTERTTWTTWTTPAGRQRCVAAHSQKNGWASILEEIPMAHWWPHPYLSIYTLMQPYQIKPNWLIDAHILLKCHPTRTRTWVLSMQGESNYH